MLRRVTVILLCLTSLGQAAQTAPTTPKVDDASPANASQQNPAPSPSPTPSQPAATSDALFDLGKSLFDEYAPPEVKDQFEFPSKEQWDAFAAQLQRALDGDSFEELAAYEPQARAALLALRTIPNCEDYTSWLEEKLDLITAAKEITQPPRPPKPDQPKPPTTRTDLPQYDLWLQRISTRPLPPNAEKLLPLLIEQFSTVGSPRDLVWLAEVESTFNPFARSPAGARAGASAGAGARRGS